MKTVNTHNILNAVKSASYSLQVKAATDTFYATKSVDKLSLRLRKLAKTISDVVVDCENEFVADRLIDASDAMIVSSIYQQLAIDKRANMTANIDKLVAKRAELDKLIAEHTNVKSEDKSTE